MDPRDALRQFHARTLPEPSLLRVLSAHGAWRLPAVREGEQVRPLLRQVGADRWLQIFTDADAFDAHLLPTAGEEGAPPGWVETTGEWVLAHLSDDLAGLDVNAGLAEAVHFSRASFPMLRSWGRALAVERLLREQAVTAEASSLLMSAHFQIAFTLDGAGQPQLALAPDPQGRALAAVFTAPDTALTYQQAASKALQREIQLNEVPGGQLFAQLAQMSLDGIVFNCLGPVVPVAVSMQFAKAFGRD